MILKTDEKVFSLVTPQFGSIKCLVVFYVCFHMSVASKEISWIY